jgi:hypothetical protein
MRERLKSMLGMALVVSAATVGLVAIGASSAWAVTTGTGTATCSAAAGKISFHPPLKPTGTASTETIKLILDASGCTPTASNNVTSLRLGKVVTHWTITGTNVNTCSAALPASGAIAVPLPVIWKGRLIPPNTPPIQDTTFTSTGEIWAPSASPPTLELPVTGSALGSFPLSTGPTVKLDLIPAVGCSTILKAYRITSFSTPNVTF